MRGKMSGKIYKEHGIERKKKKNSVKKYLDRYLKSNY